MIGSECNTCPGKSVLFIIRWPAQTAERIEALADEMCNRESEWKMWGIPIRLGPGRFHIYGCSCVGYRPVNVEIMLDRMIVDVPVNRFMEVKETPEEIRDRLIVCAQKHIDASACVEVDKNNG